MDMASWAHSVSLGLATLLFGYFMGGLLPFAWRCLRHRGLPFHDPHLEARRRSPLVPRWAMYYLVWAIAPLERALVRLHVFPNSVTLSSLLLSVVAAVALGMGFFDLGGWLFLLSGILDILDGRVARATGRVSPAGALFDSVLDRYAEFVAYTGLLVYYRDVWVFYAALALQLGSFMISYSRARGEGLGVTGDVGTMQRPERILLLGCAVGGAPFLAHVLEPDAARPFFHLAAVAVCLLALASNVTAVARFRYIYRALGGAKRAPEPTQGAHPAAAEPARPAA